MTMPTALQGRLRLPVIAAPMFIVSGPELVIAECQAGVLGAFPALNARPQAALDQWITRIKTELAAFQSAHPERPVAPFAVNQIVHQSNDRLAADWDTIIAHEVPVIITSLRAPDPQVVERIHAYGGIILHDVINIRHAKKAAQAGVDGLILVCAGAGGHAGTTSPFALVSEVKAFFDGAIILSGAIANGAAILSAQALGADIAYMGTRFIATGEANADDAYKDMLVQHAADDIVYTNLFTGVHGNYLKPSIEAAGLDPNELPVSDKTKMNFGSGGNTRAKAWKDIWGAGQGLGSIDDKPSVAELVDRLENEYRTAAARLQNTLAPVDSP